MTRCFVIQPFDRGPFDNRYDDVLAPAIEKAGIKPYRVDRDPSVSIPIETIEEYIRDSEYCLADTSLDNPNVWYEVGYAFARGKDVVLLCSQERTTFPFDVRHRSIITYTTHSTRDFAKLSDDITARLKALAKKTKTIAELPPIEPTEGLSPHELSALALIMAERVTPDSGVSPFSLRDDMRKAGFTRIATSLAFEGLREKGMIEIEVERNFNGDELQTFKMTEAAVRWCMINQNLFCIRKLKQKELEDEDIPF